jgi:hypothetical protein
MFVPRRWMANRSPERSHANDRILSEMIVDRQPMSVDPVQEVNSSLSLSLSMLESSLFFEAVL